MKLDIPWFVDSMNIAKTSGDGEKWRDGAQRLVDVVDIFWLGVQRVVVYAFIVHSVFFPAGNPDFLYDKN